MSLQRLSKSAARPRVVSAMSLLVAPEAVIPTASAPLDGVEDSGEEVLEVVAAVSAIIDDEPIVTRRVRIIGIIGERYVDVHCIAIAGIMELLPYVK